MQTLEYDKNEYEWIIVDDGSSDDIANVIAIIQNEKIIQNFVYVKHKTNRGIHVAHNTAVRIARGEFITRIDSDDYLMDDALIKKDYYYNLIPNELKPKFAGVVGLVLQTDMTLRSSKLGKEIIDSTGIAARKKYKASGDRNYCIRRDILLHNLFPEYEDTNWVPEEPMWLAIDASYLTRFVDVPFSVARFGASNSITSSFLQKKNLKNMLSLFYKNMLMINKVPWSMNFFEKRKTIIAMVALGIASSKFEGKVSKIIGMLDSRYYRFVAFFYLPVAYFAYIIKKNK
jgi:glycosyltransferase involved in cell wall biosynthesis